MFQPTINKESLPFEVMDYEEKSRVAEDLFEKQSFYFDKLGEYEENMTVKHQAFECLCTKSVQTNTLKKHFKTGF